jgi:hypothetical protein
MSVDHTARMIRGIFAAYLSNDRAAVENALTDDFRFTSPYDDRIDKATYFERCWRNADWIERHDLEKIFVQGDEAFATCNCVAKSGNSEFFTFEGDKVKRIEVYFGATYQKTEPELPACRLRCISTRWRPIAIRR